MSCLQIGELVNLLVVLLECVIFYPCRAMAEERDHITQNCEREDHQDMDSSFDDLYYVNWQPMVSKAAVGDKTEPKVGGDLCTALEPTRVMGAANIWGRGRGDGGKGRVGAGMGMGVERLV